MRNRKYTKCASLIYWKPIKNDKNDKSNQELRVACIYELGAIGEPMNRRVLILLLLLSLLNNCKSQSIDSSISIFGDYVLNVSIFNSEEENDYTSSKNATIRFLMPRNGNTSTVFCDSTFCRHAILKREDFNGDGIKDILVFYDYDVRSNEMYHLYIVDSKNKNLIRVEEFEDLKNPTFNKRRNRIECYVVSGTNYTTFHKIIKLNQLINLGTKYEE